MFTSIPTHDALRAELDYRRDHLRALAPRRHEHGWMFQMLHRTRRHG